jgi:hypothetical protein
MYVASSLVLSHYQQNLQSVSYGSSVNTDAHALESGKDTFSCSVVLYTVSSAVARSVIILIRLVFSTPHDTLGFVTVRLIISFA